MTETVGIRRAAGKVAFIRDVKITFVMDGVADVIIASAHRFGPERVAVRIRTDEIHIASARTVGVRVSAEQVAAITRCPEIQRVLVTGTAVGARPFEIAARIGLDEIDVLITEKRKLFVSGKRKTAIRGLNQFIAAFIGRRIAVRFCPERVTRGIVANEPGVGIRRRATAKIVSLTGHDAAAVIERHDIITVINPGAAKRLDP